MSIWQRTVLALALLTVVQAPNAVAQTVSVLGYAAAKNVNPKTACCLQSKHLCRSLVMLRAEIFGLNTVRLCSMPNITAVIADLIEHKVSIIVAANVAAAVAAAKATTTIPIVMLAVNDPVGVGLVKSLDVPGTNVTGTTMYAPHLIGERLRILKTIVPTLDKVAMAFNGNNKNNLPQFELLRSEAQALGVEVLALDIRKPEDVDVAFEKAVSFGTKAFLNGVDTFINSRRFALAAGAAKHKLPALYTDVEYVLAGGLMSLGPGHYEGYHGAAKYVDQILRGANPAELAIARPTQFTLSVNRKTLANLSLSLPPDLSARVNEWID